MVKVVVKKGATVKQEQVPALVFGESGQSKIAAPAFLQAASARLIAQTVHVQRRRLRIRRAHTKDRSEVRGGGAKPWKQKGTGRSRHGSIRSPLWVGGGITFGPRARRERITSSPLKERRLALSGSLHHHLRDDSLVVVTFKREIPVKTKEVAKALGGRHGLLIVVDSSHRRLRQSARNLPGIRVRDAYRVTVQEIIEAQQVWLDDAALKTLAVRCAPVAAVSQAT